MVVEREVDTMPNWVYNSLTVVGTEDEILQFNKMFKEGNRPQWLDSDETDIIKRKGYSYAVFVAPPGSITSRPYMATPENKYSGFEWVCDNWGVKWDLDGVEVHLSSGDESGFDASVEYIFDSPWASPTPVVQAMSKQYPHLCFCLTSEDEEGNVECLEYLAGEVTLHTQGKAEEY